MRAQKLLIDGTWTKAPGSFDVTDPWDGSLVGRAAAGGPQDAARAAAAAHAASAREFPAHARAAVLR
jgi:succinate-semialdehyde dehydrogenase / glutarate-semialdehyde dehydrogenase